MRPALALNGLNCAPKKTLQNCFAKFLFFQEVIVTNNIDIGYQKNDPTEQSGEKLESDESTKHFFEETQETQIDRHVLLRNYCRNIEGGVIGKEKLKFDRLYYSDKKSVLYCSVPKAACTNWKRMFLYFEGRIKHPLEISHKEKIHLLGYKTLAFLNNTNRKYRLNSYYTFFFTRHPLVRVLSAFRNKFEDPYNNVFRHHLSPIILKLFRPNVTEEEMENKTITFAEFVDYIIYCKEKGIKLDEHWDVVYDLCTPCSIKYNFIGKMETLLDDARQVLTELGLQNETEFPVNATDKYKKNILDEMKSYYSHITLDSISKLIKIYKKDFEIFNYSIPDYLFDKKL